MRTKPISRFGRCAVLVVMLFVSGWRRHEVGYPRFDMVSIEVQKLRAQLDSYEARLRSSELPATDEFLLQERELIRRRLADWEPRSRPELQRYWSEQGRTRARADLAEGKLRLFYIVGPPRTEGPFPFWVPPLDEFEALLRERQPGFRLERLAAPHGLNEAYFEVNSRCDGYNDTVKHYLREQHGLDLVDMLWRVANRNANTSGQPTLSAPEVWLPFVSGGISACLLGWLVSTRRRRERGLRQQTRAVNVAVR